MSIIGLLASTEKTVKLGRIHMRPFQWHLKIHWRIPMPLNSPIPWTQKMIQHRMVKPSEHFAGRILTPQGARRDLYRCLKRRLGCSLKTRLHRWSMVYESCHIPGSLNVIADGLSRRNQIQHTEWSLCPQIFKQIAKLWEQVHLFTTRLNAKLPLYVYPIPDEQACAVDALNISWENLIAYTFPPSALLPRVVQKLMSQNCRLILIAPGWPTKPWFWDLVELSLDLSGTDSTSTLSANATTEQPIPQQPRIPEPSCLVSRSTSL